MNDIFTSMYVTGQHKNKQISDRLEYITHLHQHTWSIHNSYVSKCAYKISQIFSRVFEFALAEKPRNPRKFMYREYFRVYSNLFCDESIHLLPLTWFASAWPTWCRGSPCTAWSVPLHQQALQQSYRCELGWIGLGGTHRWWNLGLHWIERKENIY